MRGRRKGDTHAAKLARQEQAYRLLLRGLTVSEAARQLGVTERTMQLDFQEIKANLFGIIQTEELRSLKLALAELDELWRETWIILHRPPREIPMRQGNETIMVKEDDRRIKLAAIDRLTQIAAEKNRLTFPAMQGTPGVQSLTQQNTEGAVAEFIDSLPTTLRNAVVEYAKKRITLLENNS